MGTLPILGCLALTTSWGRETARSAQGAWWVFVRHGDKGQRLVTHVARAEEERAVRAPAGHCDHEH